MNKPEKLVRMPFDDAIDLAANALKACGASEQQAASLARAAIDADAHGHHSQGIDHLDPFCDGLLKGRLNGGAEPVIDARTAVIWHGDAGGGSAHYAFDCAFERLCESAKSFGLAAFSLNNSYPCGELGYFVRRLLDERLGGLAATNSGPAFLAAAGATKPVFCTNPLAFGMPGGDGGDILIDQSSSASAFTNIRRAARFGESIPLGWALDADGEPTDDPKKAIEGVLLAYGGFRGANMAMMVELLAAGLGGANWSLDAPPFHKGSKCPGGGLFILAIDPAKFAGDGFQDRLSSYLERLRTEFGVHLPGKRKFTERQQAEKQGVALPEQAIANLKRYLASSAD